LLLIFY
jgi:sentrin-specific protease 1